MSDTRPMTVGELRAVIDGAGDEEQIVIMTPGNEDMAVIAAWGSTLIPWTHDCTDWDTKRHRPGKDCPTVPALGIHAQPIGEFEGFETDEEPARARAVDHDWRPYRYPCLKPYHHMTAHYSRLGVVWPWGGDRCLTRHRSTWRRSKPE